MSAIRYILSVCVLRRTLKALFLFLFTVPASVCCSARLIKVLAVGNSFSQDAVEQNLYQLAERQGDSLVIGNAYIGGCSIDRHVHEYKNHLAEYAFRKVVGGERLDFQNRQLDEIIRDEPWDIITFQQASGLSGIAGSYKNLAELMRHVRDVATNPDVHFAFHETWAYAENATHSDFSNYGKSQSHMYFRIREAVHKVMAGTGLTSVIPSGIAVQRARQILGDTLNVDGYHLSTGVGRYVAACTWCEFLTGKSTVGNTYRPYNVDPQSAAVAQLCAHEAHEMVCESPSDTYKKVDDAYVTAFPAEVRSGALLIYNVKDEKKKLTVLHPSSPLSEREKTYAVPDFQVKDWEYKQMLIRDNKAEHRYRHFPYILPPVGMKMPDFTLSDINGRKWNGISVAGKPSVFVFMPGGGDEEDSLSELVEAYSIIQGVRLFVVSLKKADANAEWVNKIKRKAAVITAGHRFARRLRCGRNMTVVVFDSKGRVSLTYDDITLEKRDLLMRRLIELARL